MDSTVFNKITEFLNFAGIAYELRPVNGVTVLPGLQLENGAIIIDTEKLLYPGDILHEAGHLATASPDVRETLSDPIPDTDIHRSGEMMALSWSYAACVYIGLPPQVVFHSDGYQGGSENILKDFAGEIYIALPMLQWCGMACDKKRAAELNVLPYPNMMTWLRQT